MGSLDNSTLLHFSSLNITSGDEVKVVQTSLQQQHLAVVTIRKDPRTGPQIDVEKHGSRLEYWTYRRPSGGLITTSRTLSSFQIMHTLS